MPTMFERLADDDQVFRFQPVDGHVEAATNALPTARSLQLMPSKRDKAEAEHTKLPPGVSVWNLAFTTPAEARAIMLHDGAKDRPRRPWCAAAGRLRAVGGGVDVVAVPRTNTGLPGEAGHAHIVGLARPEGAARAAHERFLDEVAGCFSVLQE